MDYRTRNDRMGEENYNKFGSLMRIVKYTNAKCIDVYFPEYNWTFYNTNYANFKKGGIKCPYEPYIYNKGYIGEGSYTAKNNNCNNKFYDVWKDMLRRCYNDKDLLRNPSYVGCHVCDEWLNYQNFATWYDQNYYYIEGEIMNLDKDIIIKNNIVYSPETCVFVPHRINCLFIKSDNVRGEFPVGVSKSGDGFVARCKIGGIERVYLGKFNTPEDAFHAYKTFKESYIKQVADEYIDYIPYNLYEAMYNYEVEITD